MSFIDTLSADAPASLLPWLTHTQSLTEKLKHAAGETSMKVVSQGFKQDWWSQHVLELASAPVLQREIVMYAQGRACWYARTLIPNTTWQDNLALFAQLHHLSLGQLIFNPEHNISRSWLRHYAIDPGMIEFHWPQEELTAHAKQLWMRLSQFKIAAQHPFYLAEILLPGLLEVSQ